MLATTSLAVGQDITVSLVRRRYGSPFGVDTLMA
jgi:hypothetical protein